MGSVLSILREARQHIHRMVASIFCSSMCQRCFYREDHNDYRSVFIFVPAASEMRERTPLPSCIEKPENMTYVGLLEGLCCRAVVKLDMANVQAFRLI